MPELRDRGPRRTREPPQAMEHNSVEYQTGEQGHAIGANDLKGSSHTPSRFVDAATGFFDEDGSSDDEVHAQHFGSLHVPFAMNKDNMVGRNTCNGRETKFRLW